jgi:hypothetical protein
VFSQPSQFWWFLWFHGLALVPFALMELVLKTPRGVVCEYQLGDWRGASGPTFWQKFHELLVLALPTLAMLIATAGAAIRRRWFPVRVALFVAVVLIFAPWVGIFLLPES